MMTAETAVLMVAAIAGLVSMAFYVQRAVQGGVFGVAGSMGSQYDPRDHYTEDQRLTMWEEVHRQTGDSAGTFAASMVAANHLKQPAEYDSILDPRRMDGHHGWDRRKRTLESLPTGRVLREPAWQFSEITADWTGTSDARYRDIK